VLSNHDVLATLSMDVGRPICYQLPPLLMPGITVVISLLSSLVQDQVVSLFKNDMAAASLIRQLID
jgi:ATP-dependent DNA helicase RecQ